MRLRLCIPVLCLFAILALSCSSKNVRTEVVSRDSNVELSCIAVTSFNNLASPKWQAGDIVSDLIAVSLRRMQSESVLDRGDIVHSLRRQNINLEENITVSEAVWLGKMLGVDGVLIGSVTDYDYQRDRTVATGAPKVSFSVKLVATASRQVIWSGRINKTTGSSLPGTRTPITLLAMEAVDELLDSIKIRRLLSGSQPDKKCGAAVENPDIDGDGVMNLADLCPVRAETKNGIEDYDGCPELVSAESAVLEYIKLEGDRITLLNPIGFDYVTSSILSGSFAMLDELTRFLIANGEIRKLMIEGFSVESDAVGFKERLAFQRASAVKQYLTNKGVEPERLIAVGYGFTRKQPEQEVEFTIIE